MKGYQGKTRFDGIFGSVLAFHSAISEKSFPKMKGNWIEAV
jgi:hypothetical protein